MPYHLRINFAAAATMKAVRHFVFALSATAALTVSNGMATAQSATSPTARTPVKSGGILLSSLSARADWLATYPRARTLIDVCFEHLPVTGRGALAYSAATDNEGGVRVEFFLGEGRGQRQFVCDVSERDLEPGAIWIVPERERGNGGTVRPPYFTTDILAKPIPGLRRREVIGDFDIPEGVLYERQ